MNYDTLSHEVEGEVPAFTAQAKAKQFQLLDFTVPSIINTEFILKRLRGNISQQSAIFRLQCVNSRHINTVSSMTCEL